MLHRRKKAKALSAGKGWWKGPVKSFLLILIVLVGLGSAVTIGGCDGSSSSSSSSGGTITGSGE